MEIPDPGKPFRRAGNGSPGWFLISPESSYITGSLSIKRDALTKYGSTEYGSMRIMLESLSLLIY
jgi:hypothetical protein